jgi:RNA polymerase sigma-70 factor (ECF subfamily)
MTATNRVEITDVQPTQADADYADWVEPLSTVGPRHEDALRRLHGLLLRAARHQVAQMYGQLPSVGTTRIEDLVHQAADEAMVALLRKLPGFEGRSRFTTWAYKFGILHAAVEVRRNLWRHRDVTLDGVPDRFATGISPEQFSEARDLSSAVSGAIHEVLTAHQRKVVIALLVDEVPIDVLADRLGTTRNALYKTVHDARGRLRKHLTVTGYLTVGTSAEVES